MKVIWYIPFVKGGMNKYKERFEFNLHVGRPKETCKMKIGEVIHKDDWTIDSLTHDIHGFATKNGLNYAYNHDIACHKSSHYFKIEKAKYPFSFVSQPGYVKQHGNITGKLTIKNTLNKSIFRIDYAVVTLVQQESNRESIPNQQ
ncbi:hypothetical protein U3516DRAFT_846477 [Neocallimastix sp. 'constans']